MQVTDCVVGTHYTFTINGDARSTLPRTGLVGTKVNGRVAASDKAKALGCVAVWLKLGRRDEPAYLHPDDVTVEPIVAFRPSKPAQPLDGPAPSKPDPAEPTDNPVDALLSAGPVTVLSETRERVWVRPFGVEPGKLSIGLRRR